MASLCSVSIGERSHTTKINCRLWGFYAISPALMQQVNIGLVGGGTVGGGVYQAIQRNGALIASRLGVRLQIVGVAVRTLKKDRAVRIPLSLLSDDWSRLIQRADVD